MTRRRALAAAAAGLCAPWSPAMHAEPDSLAGVWDSDGTQLSGSWRWVLQQDAAAWTGTAQRQQGALPAKRWRLRIRLQEGALQATLDSETGGPAAQAQVQRKGPEHLQIVLRWPDGLTERFGLIRP